MKYRVEFDGLRALAVIPVVLFHAEFKLFNGGFVGVDVFFVLSGYLITTIIINEMENKSFNLVKFYERRARRILPALFLISFISIPFAFTLLMPQYLKDFSQSLFAVATFSSNILFLRESGYFDTAANLKPLLHTWSLAIEGQYYILFPLLLMLTWKFGKRKVVIILSVMFLVSLIFAQWGSYNNPLSAFYLLPTRGWEFLMGTLAAFYLQKKKFTLILRLQNFLSLFGLALIFFSIFLYDKTTPYPSLYTLVPTIGTLLIILFANKETITNQFLSNKVFVGIGLISYGVYLWHYPLLTFERHFSLGNSSNLVIGILCFFSIPMAYLSWKLVEQPFRNKETINSRGLLTMSLLSVLMFCSLGIIGHKTDWYKITFKEKYLGDISHEHFFKHVNDISDKCYLPLVENDELIWEKHKKCAVSKFSEHPKERIIIVGDSHGEHLFIGLAEELKTHEVLHFTRADLPFGARNEFFVSLSATLNELEPSHLIISMAWISKLKDVSKEELKMFITKFIKSIPSNIQIVFIGDVPHFKLNASYCKYRSIGCFEVNSSNISSRKKFNDVIFTIVNSNPNTRYIDPYELFQLNQGSTMVIDNKVYYRDSNHLNILGSQMVGRFIVQNIWEFQK